MTARTLPDHDDDTGQLDERAGSGMFTRAYLKGWRKHLHGYRCPRCGATCDKREAKMQHDLWHRDDDKFHEEWAEVIEQGQADLTKAEGQLTLMTELLGPALDRILRERAANDGQPVTTRRDG